MTRTEPTSIADQTAAQLGGAGSVLARQQRDHTELDRLLHRLSATSGAEQDEVLTRISRLVFPHAYAEEAVLWPVLRRTLPDGDALTLRVEKEHQEINELFSVLDRTPADDPERAQLLERIVTLLREDVRDEEDLLLPQLQQAVDARQLRRLGRRWAVVRRTAPTRPHAVVSRRPPGNVLAAVPLAGIDRARDRLDRLARRSQGRLGTVSRTGSRALARLAGAIEHLPPLRAGERAQTRAGRPEESR